MLRTRTPGDAKPPAIGRMVPALVVLRVVAGLFWLDSALVGKDAKFAPGFFGGPGLAQRVASTFVHQTIVPGGAAFLTHVVVPHAHLFAVLIAFGDLATGISLTFGILTRAGGLVAILRALANIAVAGGAGTDTIGFNVMLALVGAIAVAGGLGRRGGVDAWLLSRFGNSRIVRALA